METLKFKTNIKCDACVAKITPGLNETVGEGNWEVDLSDPQRILTVRAENLREDQLRASLQQVGYTAEKA